MLNKWFWLDTIVKQQKHEHYMNLPMELLADLL